MTNKKMIVTDLDGTLLNEKSEVTKEAQEYLTKLHKKGYIIVIATGRFLASVLKVTNGAKFADYIVCHTGPVVYEAKQWKTFYSAPISKSVAKRFFKLYDKDKFRYIDFGTKNKIYKYTIDNPFNNDLCTSYDDQNEILEICPEIYHITAAFKDNKFAEEYHKIMSNTMPELQVNLMRDSFIDEWTVQTNIKGYSKYTGVTQIAKHENISNDNIIVFGDSPNDIDVIKKCGVGVAMQNALQEVKAVAKYITKKTYTENGVIEFLKEYLKDEQIS